MAFARLFGKSTRRDDPPSPSGSTNSEREGEEGFTVVGETRPGVPSNDQQSNYYNQVMNVSQLPYQLPNQQHGYPSQQGGGAPHPPGALPPTYQTQTSVHQPLDGVLFTLSPRLKTDSELEYMTAAVDSVMAKIEGLDWGAFEYSFALERTVLVNELLENPNQDTIEDASED